MSLTSNKTPIVERLFQVGAHFGFKKSRRHPSVAKYLLGSKQGNDIFNLNKTAVLIEEAQAVLKEAGKTGKTVLFVGTKDEVKRIVKDTAEKADCPYVVNRWIGGLLTNFSEIKKRVARLLELNQEKESGELSRKYTKKERVVLGREVEKLNHNFFGISGMSKLPDLMVLVDPRHDKIALAEATELNIPTVAIMSSDCNAKEITNPIVVNDALQSSVSLVLGELSSAYMEGRDNPLNTSEAKK